MSLINTMLGRKVRTRSSLTLYSRASSSLAVRKLISSRLGSTTPNVPDTTDFLITDTTVNITATNLNITDTTK